MKQAILETGWFKSKVLKSHNNLFGFRTSSYLKFNTIDECIKYYKSWQDRKYKSGNYYEFLINVGYAEDSLYVTKLKSIKIN